MFARDGFVGRSHLEVVDCPPFDESTHELGSLCQDGHQHGNTGRSLRFIRGGNCVTCAHDNQQKRDAQIAEKKKEVAYAEMRSLESLHAVDTSLHVLKGLCKWNHSFEGSKYSLFCLKTDKCVECSKPCPDFDPSVHKLGKLCKKDPANHEWGQTGQSLRIHSGNCVLCNRARASAQRLADPENAKKSRAESRERTRDDRLQRRRDRFAQGKTIRDLVRLDIELKRTEEEIRFSKFVNLMTRKLEVDTDRFILGKLCRHRHDHKGSGLSLRYIKDNEQCVKCRSITNKQKRKRRKAKYGVAFLGNPCYQGHTHEGTDLCMRDAESGGCIECYRISGKKSSKKRMQALLENHSLPYSQAEIDRRSANFNDECAYCCVELGEDMIMTLDHFISVNQGGPDCIGNLVVACKYCNSSKQNRDPYEWFKDQDFFTQKRWKFILQVLGKTQRNYWVLPLF